MGGGNRTFAICQSCNKFHVVETFADGRVRTAGRKECPCGEQDLRIIDGSDLGIGDDNNE